MKSNLHTHTIFCDGKSTHEETVLSAIEKGFDSIGFSGHGYTDFDHSYCMTDTQGYIEETLRVKEKYKDRIKVYLGIEEDMLALSDRNRYDYIIGSCHYYEIDGVKHDVDGSYEQTLCALGAVGNDVIKLAENYYNRFCEYILSRKPDIVGHFDLLTKFDEKNEALFLGNKQYETLAEKYLLYAMKSDCIFEVNTGAISRGCRATPYPSEGLLYTLYKNGGKVTVTSDCHSAENIECAFDETFALLKDIGFKCTYMFDGEKFIEEMI